MKYFTRFYNRKRVDVMCEHGHDTRETFDSDHVVQSQGSTDGVRYETACRICGGRAYELNELNGR